MKILRMIMLVGTGLLTLVQVAGLVLHVAAAEYQAIPWTLVRLAVWGGLCWYVYRLIKKDKTAPPS